MLVEEKEPYVINGSIYLLLPMKQQKENEFDKNKPFSVRIIRPYRSRKYYFQEVYEKNGSEYFLASNMFKREGITPEERVSYEIHNIEDF